MLSILESLSNLDPTKGIFLLVAILFLFYLQALINWVEYKFPPICKSLIRLGPYAFFLNPMEFTSQKRKELRSDIFTINFFFKRLTFVFGEENVNRVTDANNEVLNFEESYAPFLGAAFGANMLTSYTIDPQVKVLLKYLSYNHLQDYALKSGRLATRLVKELGKSGECDIISVLRKIISSVGVRNFLGDDLLQALSEYDFDAIFSGFEQTGLRVAANFGPSCLNKFLDYLERNRYQKVKTSFEKLVLKLAEKPITEPTNMFEELVFQHKDKNGPTLADDQTLTNLVKLFIFGSFFNSFNLLCCVIIYLIGNPEIVKQLREELIKIGFDPMNVTQEMIAKMEKLQEVVMNICCENAFPFLLRTAKHDFKLDGYIIPKGDLIAWSPRVNDKVEDNLLFGRGVHNCPATKYAKNSMMIVMAVLIYFYNFKPVDKIESFVNTRMITFSDKKPVKVAYVASN